VGRERLIEAFGQAEMHNTNFLQRAAMLALQALY